MLGFPPWDFQQGLTTAWHLTHKAFHLVLSTCVFQSIPRLAGSSASEHVKATSLLCASISPFLSLQRITKNYKHCSWNASIDCFAEIQTSRCAVRAVIFSKARAPWNKSRKHSMHLILPVKTLRVPATCSTHKAPTESFSFLHVVNHHCLQRNCKYCCLPHQIKNKTIQNTEIQLPGLTILVED